MIQLSRRPLGWLLLLIGISSFIVSSNASILTVLGRSGLSTNIITATGTVGATYFNNTVNNFTMSDKDPNATYIWNGPGTNPTCPASISIQENYMSKCPNHKVKFHINADSKFNFTLSLTNTYTGSGTDPTKRYEYKYECDVTTCGQIFNLKVDAANTGSASCAGNPAKLAFSLLQVDCNCTDVVGTYYSWQTCTCVSCSTKILGCITCDAPNPTTVTCTSCATSSGWTLSAGVCICSVASPMVGCLNCVTSSGTCTTCDVINHYTLSAGKCVCASGYAKSGSSCVTCGTVMPNCQSCTSNTTCTGCVSTSYALSAGACPLCSAVLPNCLTCTSATVCIACTSTSYALVASSCVVCSTPLVGCLTCSSSTTCLACNTAGNFVKSGSKCVCASGYTLAGSTCSTCSSQITGCSTCTSTTVCTTCNTAGNFVTNGANGCICTSGYALSGTGCVTCGSVLPGCTACSSISTCTTCNAALHLTAYGGSCQCVSGYTDVAGTCALCSTQLSDCVTCTLTSPVSCLTCVTGYGVDAGTCVGCTIYGPQCTSCDGAACLGCDTASGFILSGGICICNVPITVDVAGVCTPCSNQIGCLQCLVMTSCQLCASGYYLDGSNNCQVCITGCAVCSNSASCTTCDTHYASIGPSCQLCGISIPGCDTCSSIGTCLTCQTVDMVVDAFDQCICTTGYHGNPGSCVTCGTTMIGCQQCTDGPFACTQCDSALNLVASGGICVCVAGYAFDGFGVCHPCSYFITACNQCSDNATCTSCDTGNGFVTITDPAMTGKCKPCGSIFTGCTSCTDDTICAVCGPTYALTTAGDCNLCSTFGSMANCALCSTNSTCTSCDTFNYMLNTGTGLCELCNTFMPGCLTCDSTTNCLSCDSANNFDFSGAACDCISPLVLKAATGTCQTCVSLLPLCQVCFVETACVVCQSGSYLNSTNQCTVCPTGCTTCNSATDCPTCDTANHYTLSGTSCICDIGYSISGGVCANVCGDGLVATTEACDDGNIVDGDGCNSVCAVEIDFSCFAFPGLPSTCSYNKPLNLSITSVVKVPGSNSVSFNFDIGPMLPSLNSINFSELIQTNISLQNPRFVLTPEGKLTVTFDYDQTYEGRPISFTITPAGGNQNLFAVPPTIVVFQMNEANNTPIAYYNETVYEQQQSFDKAYKGGIGATYGIMAIGMACDKVIGVELMGVWQVAYLSLSNIDRVQPLLEPMMSLGIVNGINSQLDFNTSEVPKRVAAIHYEAEFLSNVNYMLWLVMADVIIGASLYFIASLVPKYKEKMQEIGLRMLKEYLLMLVLFNTFNLTYSAGLQFTYCDTLVSVNSAVAALSLLLPLGAAIAVTATNPKQFGEFKNHYRPDLMSQSYFVWTILYRSVLGVCMSQMNEVEEATIVTFSISVLFTVYLMTNTPYVKGYQNYRAMVDQFAIMVSLFIAMYYRSMKSTSDVETVSQILAPAFVSIVVMYTATGISAATLGYELYLKFKPTQKPENNKIQPTEGNIQDHPSQTNLEANNVMQAALNQYP